VPCCGVTQVDEQSFANLYKIDPSLYRAEQPELADLPALEKLAIRTVINLRKSKKDKELAEIPNLQQISIPMNAFTISYEDLLTALKEIEKAAKPVLVHCKHGSDRTGAVVAAYRMTHGMTKEQAIKEFLDPRYGYHRGWFPNILKLLESIDVEKLSTDVKTN
jgi:protein tyrosine/serine phosphatase